MTPADGFYDASIQLFGLLAIGVVLETRWAAYLGRHNAFTYFKILCGSASTVTIGTVSSLGALAYGPSDLNAVVTMLSLGATGSLLLIGPVGKAAEDLDAADADIPSKQVDRWGVAAVGIPVAAAFAAVVLMLLIPEVF